MMRKLKDNPAYNLWRNMRRRCHDVRDKQFKDYGAKGILVCDQWQKSFENFIAEMGQRPTKSHSLDRIDNTLGYNKENCRWATPRQQANNRTNNVRYLTYKGETKNITDWANYAGLTRQCLNERLNRGMSLEEALTTPSKKHRNYFFWPQCPKGVDAISYELLKSCVLSQNSHLNITFDKSKTPISKSPLRAEDLLPSEDYMQKAYAEYNKTEPIADFTEFDKGVNFVCDFVRGKLGEK